MLGIIVIILLVYIGTPVLIGWLIYFITKKLGYPVLARWLTLGYFAVIFLFIGAFFLGDEFFTKNDARQLLSKQDIRLNEEFRILENKSEWIGGYYHTFTLHISENDKHTSLQSIRDAAEKAQNIISKTVTNEESDTSLRTILVIYNDKGKHISYQITVSKTGNTLKYEEY